MASSYAYQRNILCMHRVFLTSKTPVKKSVTAQDTQTDLIGVGCSLA